MSKIVITFDSETKSCSATEDGKAIDNLSSASIYPVDYDYDGDTDEKPTLYRCNVSTAIFDKASNLRRYTHLSASDKGLVNDAVVSEKVQLAITDFLTPVEKPVVVKSKSKPKAKK